MLNTVENKGKYYVPEISEFYVGFEYELTVGVNENGSIVPDINGKIYKQDSFEVTDWYLINRALKEHPNSIRVKYLDKKDVESLGFTHKEDRGMEENNGFMFTSPDPRFVKADIVIRYWVSTGSYRLRIERVNGCIFEGRVKNKSELKQVLKMIGVEYENTNN